MIESLLGSIPAPPGGNSFSLGPLTFRYYGLMIALGVLAAVEIGRRRWQAKGGNPDDVVEVGKWAVPAGLIGTRIYHVITDWKTYFSSEGSLDPIDALLIWKGGLGIPGGLILGIPVGVYVARKRGLHIGNAIDAFIPGIPVAQAFGRIGNWFNQEITGRPTDLPWGLELDPEFRPREYADATTFHPAFLYEALWNLGLAFFLIQIDKRGRLRSGQILPLYVIGYGIGRFIVEGIRIDAASQILGIRVNHWMSALAVIGGALWFFWLGQRPEVAATPRDVRATEDSNPETKQAEDDKSEEDKADAKRADDERADDELADDDITERTSVDGPSDGRPESGSDSTQLFGRGSSGQAD